MTEKLYDYDAYATEFEATVVECEKIEDGYKVILDKTLFFPLEGGQSPDKGVLDGQVVTDVQTKNGIISHFVKEPIETGRAVKGKIDFEHRFSNMQLHSGEHIFSGLTFKKYGYNNVGFHLSDNRATIDIDGQLTKEQLSELELEVNKVIVSNIEIIAGYPSKEELAAMSYRQKKELSGPIRIVSIEGADVCACCAPHVKRTGEIGIFKIVSFENYKGGTRLYYLCGFRALRDYDKRVDDLREICRTLNAKSGAELEKVKTVFEELNQVKFDNISLQMKLVENEIKAMAGASEHGAYFAPLSETGNMKRTMNLLHQYFSGNCYLFCGDDDNGYRYLIESDTEDMTKISAVLKEKLSAKGGGKPESIQGSINATRQDIEKVLGL